MNRATIQSFVSLAIVIALTVGSSFAQTDLGNQLGDHTNWDETQTKWNKGNSGGYTEGEVVPHTFIVDADSAVSFRVAICLEGLNVNGTDSTYGYVGLAAYNTDYTPDDGSCGGDANGCRWEDAQHPADGIAWDMTDANVYARNVSALSVSQPAPTCDGTGEVGWDVEFTPANPDSTVYFYYGGIVSKPGDVYPPTGHVIKVGESASNKNGVWQSRVESNADRTTQITAPESLLPVELTLFEARLDGNDVVLSWETASETDNAGFSVEHSDNGGEFTEIAFVTGAGTSLESRTYEYTVNEIGAGLHRFRLKQIDFDGAFSFSAMVEVTSEVPGTHLLSEAYPNPFNPSTSFSLAVSREQEVAINVYDMLGRRVSSLYRGTLEANVARTFSVNAANWTSGTYTVVVEGEAFRDSRSLVLLK